MLLLREFQRTASHGRLRFPQWTGRDPHNALLGWDLRYAWQTPLPDGGQRIVVALDRYMSFWEVRQSAAHGRLPVHGLSSKCAFDNDGRAEETARSSVATRINFEKAERNEVVELEDYASEPVRLHQVRVTKLERE